MKLLKIHLLFLILFSLQLPDVMAQKYIANGDKVEYYNRLISAQSEPGRKLHQAEKAVRDKIVGIEIDAKMSEMAWQNAQLVAPFVNEQGQSERSSVRVLSDKEYIYLFWIMYEEENITATVKEADMVITHDDYVQINLKPWLPDSIKWARDYYYSIAVNPFGAVWDSYFDPYLGGYFFSSWNSNIEVATAQKGNEWTIEMRIPFSDLDPSSNPGWKWNLDFWHASQLRKGEVAKLYAPQIGVTVEQGIMVRRPAMVSYYWTRPEFMEEIKPKVRTELAEHIPATVLKHPLAINGHIDDSLWDGAINIEIAHDDKTGKRLGANTAFAKIGYTDSYLCFALEAEGTKIEKSIAVETKGRGMPGQLVWVKAVNGVYRDKALFGNECFWLLVQPRNPYADRIHQKYYLITVNNRGEVNGISYDEFGTPDRSWQPEAQVDLYNTANGWGAEVNIAMTCFDLPAKCGNTWGLNIFRNRIVDQNSQPRSELQAWLYTASAFLNPETMGTVTNIHLDGKDAIRAVLECKIAKMQKIIDGYADEHQKSTTQLAKKLKNIKLTSGEDLIAAEKMLEYIDHSLGIIDAKENYAAFLHPAKGGYAVLDVKFIGDKGWAVGAMGTILRTEDRGKTWQAVDVATDVDLYRIFFINEKEGWAAGGRIRMGSTNEDMRHEERGGYGYIFHTRDGGKTWQCQYGERGRHLFGLYFVNDKVGYACGELGFLLRTDDHGQHWRMCPNTGTKRWLYGITFKDKLNGFIVGESETVLRTADGGETWTKLTAPADRQFYGFRPFYRDIAFNGSTGCIVGQNGTILISHDGGETWHATATFFDTKIREFFDLTRVQFVSSKLGYAVGELGTRFLVTEDGGASWSLRSVANTDWLRALWADDMGKVVLVGEREKILLSNDAGFSWNTVRGNKPKTDVLVMLAHGDDAPYSVGTFYAHYAINEGKQIVDIEIIRDAHSVEYEGEIYNLEHHRSIRMSGVRTTTYFDEFENSNRGCDFYHFTERLWEGEENVVRHMVAAIRAYRPDVVIIHGGVFGDYDKPGHKVSGRAGIPAFETSGGEVDHWPQLTRLGLKPWQAKKLYCLASLSYPMTLDLTPIGEIPLKDTHGSCWDWAEYVIRNFQSQGVMHVSNSKLCLIKSLVDVPEKEASIFDGL
jgi:photosystem II stability/assembly factor-like uncharacterized protein